MLCRPREEWWDSRVNGARLKSKSLKTTDSSTRNTKHFASSLANASCSISISPLSFATTTLAYRSRMAARNSAGWNVVPFVKMLWGWAIQEGCRTVFAAGQAGEGPDSALMAPFVALPHRSSMLDCDFWQHLLGLGTWFYSNACMSLVDVSTRSDHQWKSCIYTFLELTFPSCSVLTSGTAEQAAFQKVSEFFLAGLIPASKSQQLELFA